MILHVAEAIAAGVDLRVGDDWGTDALSKATLGGHAEVVRLLLDAGAHPDGEPGAGNSALMTAPTAAIAEALIKAGADPNRVIDGLTPLNTTAVWNRAEVASVLLAAAQTRTLAPSRTVSRYFYRDRQEKPRHRSQVN